MDEFKRIGLSKYDLRLGAFYCALGIGTYHPKGYANFDAVVVRELMPWQASDDFTRSTLILIVEFFRGPVRCKFIEYRISPTGFGGQPVMQLLPGEKVGSEKHATSEQNNPTSDQPSGAGV